jgi:hypothetical protein
MDGRVGGIGEVEGGWTAWVRGLVAGQPTGATPPVFIVTPQQEHGRGRGRFVELPVRWVGVIIAVLVLAVVAVVTIVAADDGGGSERPSTPLGRGGAGGEQPRTAGPAAQDGRESPSGAGASWSYDTLLRSIAGEAVRAGRRNVRVEPDLVACSGHGRAVGRPARWTRFTCTQATFRRGIGEDITFEVLVLGERRWRIVNARVGPE